MRVLWCRECAIEVELIYDNSKHIQIILVMEFLFKVKLWSFCFQLKLEWNMGTLKSALGHVTLACNLGRQSTREAAI